MKSKKIVIRTDSSKKIGTGHISRDLELAKLLKKHAEIIFLTKNNESSIKKITKNGFKAIIISSKNELENNLDQINPDIIILDVLEKYKYNNYMNFLKSKCQKLICIFDEPSKQDIKADIIINGHPKQDPEWYKNKKSTYLVSPKYFIMNPKFSSKSNKLRKKVKTILLTFGGSDHNDLIFDVLKIIDKFDEKFNIIIAIGLAFGKEDKLKQAIKKLSHKVKIKKNLPNLISVFLKSDIAITAGGNTIFERIAIGTPGITINQLKIQQTISSAFAAKKANINLGMYDKFSEEKLLNKLKELINNFESRKKISDSGKKIVDSLGAVRIANKIIQLTY